jgi:hypothetical protein
MVFVAKGQQLLMVFYDINFGFKYLTNKIYGIMEYALFLDSSKHLMASATTF